MNQKEPEQTTAEALKSIAKSLQELTKLLRQCTLIDKSDDTRLFQVTGEINTF